MPEKRLRVLVLSELFPNPVRPALGIFVERQTYHLQVYCDSTVVAPVRVFPHLRLWRALVSPEHFIATWQQWQAELAGIPAQGEVNGLPVFYLRYTSPPKQFFHGLWGFFAYPFLYRSLHRLHSENHFDLIHAHYASPCGVIALLAQRWMKVPIVLTIHGSDMTYTVKQHPLSASIIRWVFHRVNAIITNSTWTTREVTRHGGDPNKVQIVHLGANPPSDIAPRHTSEHNGTINLLSVGYLEQRKGHAYVLRALAALIRQGYKIRYMIVGNGPLEETLCSLAHELDLTDIVSFEGYKAHEEVWAYFNNCDIFVLPSWNEAFGVAYLEALSLGKVVVGCEGEGGPEDLKTLGDCIELVKPRDVDSLVLGLKQLFDNPERRQHMGEIGQRIARTYFTWERNAADTAAIYQRLLETPCA